MPRDTRKRPELHCSDASAADAAIVLLPSPESDVSGVAAEDSTKRETAARRLLQESFLDVFSGPSELVTDTCLQPFCSTGQSFDDFATQLDCSLQCYKSSRDRFKRPYTLIGHVFKGASSVHAC